MRQNLLLTVEQQRRVAESMVDMGDTNDFPSIPAPYLRSLVRASRTN